MRKHADFVFTGKSYNFAHRQRQIKTKLSSSSNCR